MAVYVNDSREEVHNKTWIASHMIADTHEELIDMAEAIGIKPSFIKNPRTKNERFLVSQQHRKRAIVEGAQKITTEELLEKLRTRNVGVYMKPLARWKGVKS